MKVVTCLLSVTHVMRVYAATSSHRRILTSPNRHIIASSHRHIIASSRTQIITSSHPRIVTSFFRSIAATSSHRRILTYPNHHIIASSHRHIVFFVACVAIFSKDRILASSHRFFSMCRNFLHGTPEINLIGQEFKEFFDWSINLRNFPRNS